jgi:magnesium-transporting ATPase (P-type)
MKQFALIFVTVLIIESIVSYFMGSTDFNILSTSWFTWIIIISLVISVVIWSYFLIMRKISIKFTFVRKPIITFILTIVICGLMIISDNYFKIEYPYNFLLSIFLSLPLLLLMRTFKIGVQRPKHQEPL